MSPFRSLPEDILTLIFEQLVGHYTTLKAAGLVCRQWRHLSLPCLLHLVDISFHNEGRLHQYETESTEILPVFIADFGAHNCGLSYFEDIWAQSLYPRQEAFRRLITQRPKLGVFVKSLTWTLTWGEWATGILTDSERCTWTIFSSLTEVTDLDLASLTDNGDEECVRQNPPTLFPKLTRLRLVGHMHRGLVRAMMRTPERLRSLDMHYLDDEGGLPDGSPLCYEQAQLHDYAYTEKHSLRSEQDIRYRPELAISDELYDRQCLGQAWIFPGPMWLPLRLLSRGDSPPRLTSLQIAMAGFADKLDTRNFNQMAQEISALLSCSKKTLKSAVFMIGESPIFYLPPARRGRRISFPRSLENSEESYREVLQAFLGRLLPILQEDGFHPDLKVRLKGFRLLDQHPDEPDRARRAGPSSEHKALFALARNCHLVDEGAMNEINVDHHKIFEAYGFTRHQGLTAKYVATLRES